MPPRRWLDYDAPDGPPIPRGHSFYGIPASIVSVIAIVAVVAVVRDMLPLSLLPLAIGTCGFASVGSLAACAAASLDQSCKLTFTWVGAGMTGAIPLAAWLASEPIVQFVRSLLLAN